MKKKTAKEKYEDECNEFTNIHLNLICFLAIGGILFISEGRGDLIDMFYKIGYFYLAFLLYGAINLIKCKLDANKEG